MAHPRSRGENRLYSSVACSILGSSPLTRGKPNKRVRALLDNGLIPAHAGKTTCMLLDLVTYRAHPRSRGENRGNRPPYFLPRGSSPLTRGKPPLVRPGCAQGGLIPAHAGKTRPTECRALDTQAHPRSRGENSPTQRPQRNQEGSSPLTRGKLVSIVRAVTLAGLIPAHAGKTVWVRVEIDNARAHPRSRGENRCVQSRPSRTVGSSPLTRGKRRVWRRLTNDVRLIPAHAGKTGRSLHVSELKRAHPRSRGENTS